MDTPLKPPIETVTITYRYVDIIFPQKLVSYTLTDNDWMERKNGILEITFADGTHTEVFLQNALALEIREVTREEPVKPGHKAGPEVVFPGNGSVTH
jgi:hypothetical protein